MASSSNGKTNHPRERYFLVYLSPTVRQLLKALASIVDNPFRPDLTMQYITAAVSIQARNINRVTRRPRTHEEQRAERYKLRQQLNEIDFTLDVISVLKMSMDVVSQELAKRNKK